MLAFGCGKNTRGQEGSPKCTTLYQFRKVDFFRRDSVRNCFVLRKSHLALFQTTVPLRFPETLRSLTATRNFLSRDRTFKMLQISPVNIHIQSIFRCYCIKTFSIKYFPSQFKVFSIFLDDVNQHISYNSSKSSSNALYKMNELYLTRPVLLIYSLKYNNRVLHIYIQLMPMSYCNELHLTWILQRK